MRTTLHTRRGPRSARRGQQVWGATTLWALSFSSCFPQVGHPPNIQRGWSMLQPSHTQAGCRLKQSDLSKQIRTSFFTFSIASLQANRMLVGRGTISDAVPSSCAEGGSYVSHITKMLSPPRKGSLNIAHGFKYTSESVPGACPVEEPS
jgi:hypothetical protein